MSNSISDNRHLDLIELLDFRKMRDHSYSISPQIMAEVPDVIRVKDLGISQCIADPGIIALGEMEEDPCVVITEEILYTEAGAPIGQARHRFATIHHLIIGSLLIHMTMQDQAFRETHTRGLGTPRLQIPTSANRA